MNINPPAVSVCLQGLLLNGARREELAGLRLVSRHDTHKPTASRLQGNRAQLGEDEAGIHQIGLLFAYFLSATTNKNGFLSGKPHKHWRRVPESNRPTRICNQSIS